ncbi:MAG: YceD family protein [Paracoccus sp. (in: a-proteobacteria)]
MSARNILSERLRVAHLSPNHANEFNLTPGTAARTAIAAELDLTALSKMRFSGTVQASGADEWILNGLLEADITQPCVITLEPVHTSLSEDVSLTFSPHIAPPEEDEIEMGDENIEILGQWIELGAIAMEALALALPVNPRLPDAEMPQEATDPNDDGTSGDTRKPFAGLADLMKSGQTK